MIVLVTTHAPIGKRGSMSTPPPEHPLAPLSPGTPAPDFRLRRAPYQTLSLSSLLGQLVVLAFYPADWEAVSAEQLATLQQCLPELRRLGAALLGLSVDGVWCHLAFARAHRLDFPLLADSEPKGLVARAYGVYRERDGTSERALFVLDAAGVIRWREVVPPSVDPGADGILTALERLRGAATE
jgi:peroxiredoxin